MLKAQAQFALMFSLEDLFCSVHRMGSRVFSANVRLLALVFWSGQWHQLDGLDRVERLSQPPHPATQSV